MKTYQVAVIGCGHMGQTYLRHLSRMDNIKILAVADTDLQAASQAQAQYGVPYCFSDYHNAVSLPQCDIVIIAVYPSQHLEIVRECVRHNKHVICEKPVAGNLTETAEFARYMKNAKVKILAGYILRYNESYRRIHDLIQSDTIGHPVVMRMTQNHRAVNWERYKKLIEETSPIIDCGVHYADVMEWTTGEKIVDVSAVGAVTEKDLPAGCYNYGMITVRLSDGSAGYYEAGWGKSMSAVNEKEWIGPKGSVRLISSFGKNGDMRAASPAELEQYSNETSPGYAEFFDTLEIYDAGKGKTDRCKIRSTRKPVENMLRHLIAMIEEDADPIPSAEEIIRSMQTVLEADRIIVKTLADAQEENRRTG